VVERHLTQETEMATIIGSVIGSGLVALVYRVVLGSDLVTDTLVNLGLVKGRKARRK
jgi:hypothetical protein